MTCRYDAFFAAIWITNVLAIPAAGTLLVWALANTGTPPRAAVGAVGGVAALAWLVYLRLHGPRVLMRAAAWPAVCTGDYFPRTEEELTAAAAAVMAATGKPPEVVGSGWGFFLYRRGPRGPRIFLHLFRGRVAGAQRWKAGSTIAQVNRALRARNLTFRTHPSMDYISLGSWFACSNHGNGGEPAGRSSDALKNARVLDMRTNSIETLEYPRLREAFDAEHLRIRQAAPGADPCRYCIVDCAFHNLADNGDVQKRCIVVDSPAAAAAWLNPTQELRLLFLGAARDVGLGVQWGPLYDSEYHKHRDPHFCSRCCSFLQVDVFSAVCGWYESASYEVDGVKYLKSYTGVTTRYEANRWMPPVYPVQTISVVLFGYRNFEIFFKPARRLDGNTLWQLVKELVAMHRAHGGRSEIRHGPPDGAVCVDVSMNKRFDAPFRLLKQQFGVGTVALHPGKWNDPRELSTKPCARVPIGQL
jgi:hypothetical protein